MDGSTLVGSAHSDTESDRNETKPSLSRLEAIRKYPWAFAWCLFAIWTILLATCEDGASNSALSIPQFRKDFGSFYKNDYVLDASWQAAFNGGPIATRVIGALCAGQVADYIGRRNTLVVAVAISLAAATLEMFASTNAVFFGGKLLNGLSVAAIEAVSGAYVGEISPLPLRGLMTVLMSFAASIGSIIISLIINATGTYDSRWAYRAVFASQYGFAVIPVVFIWFMPESPYWLLSKGRDEQAIKSLQRLGYCGPEDEKTLAKVKLDLFENQLGNASYIECFRGIDRRRTIVATMPSLAQIFAGILFLSFYATYYAQLAGFSASASFKLGILQQVLVTVGNMMSWYLIESVGRRDLTVWGTFTLSCILWVIGGLAVGGSRAELKGAVILILVWGLVYSITVGSTAYTYLTEVPTARLRAKTISVGLAAQSLWALGWSLVLPYMFNPDKGNLGGRVGFIFAALSLPCSVFLWWYQPETAKRSYEELDEMFKSKISARSFKTYKTRAQEEQTVLERRRTMQEA